MKTFLKTLIALTLVSAFLLTGCETPDVSSGSSYDVSSTISDVSSEVSSNSTNDWNENTQIYDDLTEQKSKEVEANPKTFTSEQLEYYEAILLPFDKAFGVASVPGLDFKYSSQIPSDRLINFYYVNKFESYLNEHPTSAEKISVPAEEVEAFVQNHFDVSEDYLHTTERFPYDEQSNTYLFKTEMGFGGMMGYEILNVIEKENLLIFFCSGGVIGEFATKGCNIIVVDLRNDGYRYICAKSLMKYI